VVAVAARDRSRAQAFAARHGIPRVLDSYQALVDDPELDALYVPLPNAAHAEWTLAAVAAGKHVLCEKPLTANAAEAQLVVDAAAAAPHLVVMEAFHWRYHPLALEVIAAVREGRIGELRRVEAALCFPLYRPGDIRWQLDLAGGGLMDAGCYPVNIVRHLAGREPQVISARAKLRHPGVDRWVRAELDFGSGLTGAVTASMWSARVLALSFRVTGTAGSIRVFNPQAPHLYNRVTITDARGRERRRVRGRPTYSYQLEAFAAAVRDGPAAGHVLTPPADSLANMKVIDDIYRAAGLLPRPGRVA
jgi:predicted dehydrogenase